MKLVLLRFNNKFFFVLGRPPIKPLPSKFEPSKKSFDNFKRPTLPSKSVKQRPSTSRPRTVSRSSDVSSSGRNLRFTILFSSLVS